MQVAAASRPPASAAAPSPHAVLRRCACGGRAGADGECEQCRGKRPGLQRSAVSAGPALAPSSVHRVLASPGRPLDAETRAFMEPRFGHSFADVRVHADSAAADSAREVGAHAYAVGRHVVFGGGAYAPATEAGRRLLAHELAHVVQQRGPGSPALSPPLEVGPSNASEEREARAAAEAVTRGAPAGPIAPSAPALRRQERPLPPPHPAGDTTRQSPANGVAIRGGTLAWTLAYRGIVTSDTARGEDVLMSASYTLAPGAAPACRTVTFFQTVVSTAGGLPDTSHLLPRRDPASGASADVLERETEPYFGAGPAVGGGLAPEPMTGGRTFALAGSGRGATATFEDRPMRGQLDVPPAGLRRSFETAVICVDTGELLGSVRWGYTKGYDGAIALTGATPADVSASGASAAAEDVRTAFYTGTFQHSLGGFARGSANLAAAHLATLRTVAARRDLRRVVLVGANDNSGGPEADPGLSLRRAEAARDALVRLGVPPAIIEVQGIGVAAREPNPAGQQLPANRRVDVQLERGSTVRGAEYGTPGEAPRLRYQNPDTTLYELVDWVQRNRRRGTAVIPDEEWNQLVHIQDALRHWRREDPTVPDTDAIFAAEIRSLRTRRGGAPDPASRAGPAPDRIPELMEEMERRRRRRERLP